MTRERVPPGCGPALARIVFVPKEQRLSAAVSFAAAAALFPGLVCLLERRPPGVLLIALGLATWLSCVVLSFSAELRAGRGWLADRWGFVRTDRLTRITWSMSSAGFQFVTFRDTGGRRLRVMRSDLRRDLVLYGLVCDGIRESVQRGLRADDVLTAVNLGIPIRPGCERSPLWRFIDRVGRRREGLARTNGRRRA